MRTDSMALKILATFLATHPEHTRAETLAALRHWGREAPFRPQDYDEAADALEEAMRCDALDPYHAEEPGVIPFPQRPRLHQTPPAA